MDYTLLRRHPRVTVDLFADWGWDPLCEHYDKVTSLSLGGCFLATKQELRPGDEIFLRLSAQVSGPISLKGTVRRQLRIMEGAALKGVGVEFLNVSTEGAKKLQSVLDQYK